MKFWKGQRSVQLRRPVRRKSASAAKTSRPPVSDLSPADAVLFEMLRQWRADTAREQSVPAYVILHDKTLRELAEIRPVSHGLLAGITGKWAAPRSSITDKNCCSSSATTKANDTLT